MSVGQSAETAQFCLASIRAWWEHLGKQRFPDATRLTITADCGGRNSPRTHLWKVELQRFADDTGLVLKLCHYHRERRNGTKSSTGCSASSASTGAGGR